MKHSTRARYGLRALLYLAEQDSSRTVPVREIAEKENISADYLEHLLHAIKGAGLVKSVRGAAGGFNLAKPASQITLKDVFVSLDEDIDPVWCLSKGEVCPRENTCKSQSIWNTLGSIIEDFLEKTSLADAVSSGNK